MTIAFAAAFTGRYVTNLKKFQELFVRSGLFLPSLNPVPFTGVFLNALECRECKPLLSATCRQARSVAGTGRCSVCSSKKKKRYGALWHSAAGDFYTESHTQTSEACHCFKLAVKNAACAGWDRFSCSHISRRGI